MSRDRFNTGIIKDLEPSKLFNGIEGYCYLDILRFIRFIPVCSVIVLVENPSWQVEEVA